MSLFPYEDLLTKEIESWKGFADRLPTDEDRKVFMEMLDNCYKYAKATNFSSNAASTMTDYYFATLDFVYKYNLAIFESAIQAVSSVLNLSIIYPQEAQDTIRTVFNSTLDRRLNEDNFASSLAAALNSWTEIMDLFKYFQFAKNFSDYLSYVSRQFEPLRDNLNRTPSEIIEMEGRFNLIHYKTNFEPKQKTPLLVVYSLINRHYILDLLPKYSVIDNRW